LAVTGLQIGAAKRAGETTTLPHIQHLCSARKISAARSGPAPVVFDQEDRILQLRTKES
jgi:hypothetical protein